MKLYIFKTLLFLVFTSLVFSIPIGTDSNDLKNNTNNSTDMEVSRNTLSKRIDYGTYFKSMGNYFTTKHMK